MSTDVQTPCLGTPLVSLKHMEPIVHMRMRTSTDASGLSHRYVRGHGDASAALTTHTRLGFA